MRGGGRAAHDRRPRGAGPGRSLEAGRLDRPGRARRGRRPRRRARVRRQHRPDARRRDAPDQAPARRAPARRWPCCCRSPAAPCCCSTPAPAWRPGPSTSSSSPTWARASWRPCTATSARGWASCRWARSRARARPTCSPRASASRRRAASTSWATWRASTFPARGADVVVTDGFTGNVALKVLEGTSRLVRDGDRRARSARAPCRPLGGLLIRGRVGRLRERARPGGGGRRDPARPAQAGGGGPRQLRAARASPARSAWPGAPWTRTWSGAPPPRSRPPGHCDPRAAGSVAEVTPETDGSA